MANGMATMRSSDSSPDCGSPSNLHCRCPDCDLESGKITITKAVVEGQMKNRTKTNQDREIALCPRALQVLQAQVRLT